MYDVNYHKMKKREGLPIGFANGVGIGLISQFFADIIFSLISDNVLETDVIISDISLYYAAASAGAIAGILGPFMDRFAIVFFSVVTFAFVNNYVQYLRGRRDFDLTNEDIIFNIIVTIVVIYCFDKKAIPDYLNHYYERHCVDHPRYNSDKSSFEFLFILCISNLINFAFLK